MSIEQKVDELLREVKSLAADMAVIRAMLTSQKGPPPRGAAAEAPRVKREQDGSPGDRVIKKAPKDWAGEQIEGCPMSQLSPATLREYAEQQSKLAAWAADKGIMTRGDNPKPLEGFYRADAAYAYAWADWREKHPLEPDQDPNNGYGTAGDSDIPF